MSVSLWPYRLLYPWGSPGKNTGAGCHALLQGIFLTQGSNPSLLCPQPFIWILCFWATGETQMRGEGLGEKVLLLIDSHEKCFTEIELGVKACRGRDATFWTQTSTLPVIKNCHHCLMAVYSNHAHHTISFYYIISKFCPNVLKKCIWNILKSKEETF